MKRITYLLMFCLFAAPSCDLLNRPVYNNIEYSTFYKNEKDINLAVIGSYGRLATIYAADYVKYAELPGDNSQALGDTGDNAQLDKFIISPVSTVLQSAWRYHYNCIANVNEVLAAIPNITFTSEAKQQQLEGEALFIRALCYFNLVRLFGDVPYIDKPISVEASQKLTRTAAQTIYDEIIIPDLIKAQAQLPKKADYAAEDLGRATWAAAASLLGKVYLTLQDWKNAETVLGEVIASKEYSLLPVYADVFDPNNANHAESIFEIQYEKGYTGGSRWSCQAHSQQLATALGISCSSVTMPTVDIFNALSEDSAGAARKAASVGEITIASGAKVKHVKKHYMELSIQNHSDDNWPLLRYADVLLMYAEALNEQSAVPTQDAIDCINLIRRRAHAVTDDTTHDLTPADVIDQTTFRQVIAHERRLELCFEGHRWFDLVRTGEYQRVMNAYFEQYNSSNYVVEDYNNLMPIPQREIDVNPNLLPNNRGYN